MSLAKKINLRPDEEIVLVVKAFLLTYFWLYFLGFIFMGTASFLMFWLFSQGMWGYIVFALSLLTGAYIIFRTWYFTSKNLSVITTERLVDINRAGWFDEYLSVIHFDDVVDVHIRRNGFWSNLLNYGSITIETSDEEKSLELNQIKSPQEILDLILEYKNNFENIKILRNREAVYKGFLKIIPYLPEEQLCEIQDLVNEQFRLIDQEKVVEEKNEDEDENGEDEIFDDNQDENKNEDENEVTHRFKREMI